MHIIIDKYELSLEGFIIELKKLHIYKPKKLTNIDTKSAFIVFLFIVLISF